MARISEFQIKDIVNVGDGKKLGNISDINLNLAAGTIDSIVISRSGKMFGLFGKEEEVVIPWSQIVKIGEDVILVRYSSLQTVPYDVKPKGE
ncbi:YlmC/YmxH family sporulation protein [Bacillus ectoiniformans]|uniref:YlmC/YmxH family sporulation protein n=1 Tax=Bacillus ectoiniformans TaxID=1494429 RepID=UPI001958410F|nr:YlmC/YmxH family sporulation protein [Bacillus ectoiniformans]